MVIKVSYLCFLTQKFLNVEVDIFSYNNKQRNLCRRGCSGIVFLAGFHKSAPGLYVYIDKWNDTNRALDRFCAHIAFGQENLMRIVRWVRWHVIRNSPGPPRPGNEPRTLAWKAAVITTTLGPPPPILTKIGHIGMSTWQCHEQNISVAPNTHTYNESGTFILARSDQTTVANLR